MSGFASWTVSAPNMGRNQLMGMIRLKNSSSEFRIEHSNDVEMKSGGGLLLCRGCSSVNKGSLISFWRQCLAPRRSAHIYR